MAARGVPCSWERRTRARIWSGCVRASRLAMGPAPTRRQCTAQRVASGSAMLTPRMSIGTRACCRLNGSGELRHMLNLSDVLTYLMCWQDEQTNLRILLSTGDGRFSFDCTLLGFSDTGYLPSASRRHKLHQSYFCWLRFRVPGRNRCKHTS